MMKIVANVMLVFCCAGLVSACAEETYYAGDAPPVHHTQSYSSNYVPQDAPPSTTTTNGGISSHTTNSPPSTTGTYPSVDD